MPIIVGEDIRAARLWKALYDEGVYTNVALHPAVPPAGALLRTSLMATHEAEHLDRALGMFERVDREIAGARLPADFVLIRYP